MLDSSILCDILKAEINLVIDRLAALISKEAYFFLIQQTGGGRREGGGKRLTSPSTTRGYQSEVNDKEKITNLW